MKDFLLSNRPFFVRNIYAQEATHSFFPLSFLILINFSLTFGSRVRGEHTSFIAYSGHGAYLWTVLYFFCEEIISVQHLLSYIVFRHHQTSHEIITLNK